MIINSHVMKVVQLMQGFTCTGYTGWYLRMVNSIWFAWAREVMS